MRLVAAVMLGLACGFGLATPAHAQALAISTVAGGGVGDGGSALLANVSRPTAIAVDARGNFFVVDASGFVRRVDALTGVITLFAGGGPSLKDGGPATGTTIGAAGLAFDSLGNLHVADTTGVRIRRIDARTGIITTVAGNGIVGFGGDGGAATAASLSQPAGIAFDRSDNLYIADRGNHRIRKVTASTGVITTFAGDGIDATRGDGARAASASLSSPRSVACDSLGNVYLLETYVDRIRKVDVETGLIDTLAGGDTFGFEGDGGGAGQARFDAPTGLAIDALDNLYIADSLNNRIRRIEPGSNSIETVAGSGPTGLFSGGILNNEPVVRFSGNGGRATEARMFFPEAVAVDARGQLYISDTQNDVVRKVDGEGVIDNAAGSPMTVVAGDGGLATNALLGWPLGLAFAANGDFYVSTGTRIRKVTASTGVISAFAGTGNPNASGDGGRAIDAGMFPDKLALDAAGNLYFGDSSRVRRIDARTGFVSTIAGGGTVPGDGGLATAARLLSPNGLAFDRAGNLYVADQENHRVVRIAMDTRILTTVAGNGIRATTGDGGRATSASIAQPTSVAFDSAENLYVLEWGGTSRVRRIDAATGIITTIAGGGSVVGDGGPATSANLGSDIRAGIVIDANDNLFISGNRAIRKVAAGSGVISTVASGLLWPAALAFDPQGNLHVADFGNHRVRKASAHAPNHEGLWWSSPPGSESGWGLNVAHQGEILFATWFTYDADGNGLWMVMSNGASNGDGSYSGALYRTTGPAFDATAWNPSRVETTLVGSAKLRFGNSNNGLFGYTVNGVTQTKAIARQVFAVPVPTCVAGGTHGASPNYQDLWWGAPAGSESGWGVNITHQGDILFATWFTYDAAGKGQWLVVSNGAKTAPGSYAGALYRTRGPAFSTTPWDPARVTRAEVGTASFTFSDSSRGVFSYVLDGVAQSKPITRQVYSTPPTVCN